MQNTNIYIIKNEKLKEYHVNSDEFYILDDNDLTQELINKSETKFKSYNCIVENVTSSGSSYASTSSNDQINEFNKINVDKINVDKIDVDKIDVDKIDVDKINVDKIDVDKINADKINADKINADKINADKINVDKETNTESYVDLYVKNTLESEEKIKCCGIYLFFIIFAKKYNL
jgi:hypothetical protein